MYVRIDVNSVIACWMCIDLVGGRVRVRTLVGISYNFFMLNVLLKKEKLETLEIL